MIDWNGNGKIDPVDVGITMAMLDDDDNNGRKPESPNGKGCLSTLITLSIFVFSVVVGICAIVG